MKTEGYHLHPIQTAALDPNEILRECNSLLNWMNKKGGEEQKTANEIHQLILTKQAPKIWEKVAEIHLRLSSKFPEEEEALLGWSLLQSLNRAYRKWERTKFPYKEIFDPKAETLEDAESRCREALLLSMSFEPFLKGTSLNPKEGETPRHCLSYTLLSCLHSESPSLEGDLKQLRELAFNRKVQPKIKETPNERIMILTQTILLLAYGSAISKEEWSRPNSKSILELLTHIYENPQSKIVHLIPKETRDIYETLKRLQLLQD